MQKVNIDEILFYFNTGWYAYRPFTVFTTRALMWSGFIEKRFTGDDGLLIFEYYVHVFEYIFYFFSLIVLFCIRVSWKEFG